MHGQHSSQATLVAIHETLVVHQRQVPPAEMYPQLLERNLVQRKRHRRSIAIDLAISRSTEAASTWTFARFAGATIAA